MSNRAMFFNRIKFTPNVMIGGISSVVNTPALMAEKISRFGGGAPITSSDIKNFTINGNDVFFNIDINFNIGGFNNGATGNWGGGDILTYIHNTDERLKNILTTTVTSQTNLKYIIAKGCLEVNGANVFSGCINMRTLYLPKCTKFGQDVSNNGMLSSKGHLKIYVAPSLQTANSGNPDTDLSNFETSFGSVRYVTNFTPPQAIADLSINEIYSNSVKLNWSEPTSTNNIDYYEIYVDGVLNNTSKDTNGFAIGLNNLSTYNFKIIAVDEFYNKSKFSNVINQSVNGTGNWYDQFLFTYFKYENNLIDAVSGYNGSGTAISYAPSVNGNGAKFNGSTSRFIIADNNDFSFTDGLGNDKPYSISTFIKYDGNSQYGDHLINKCLSNNNSLKEWEFFTSQSSLIIRNHSTNGGNVSATILHTRVLGETFKFTITYNGNKTNPIFKLYVDKKLIPSTKTDSGSYLGMSNTTQPVYIGDNPYFNGTDFNGVLDGTAFYNKELTEHEAVYLDTLQETTELV